MKIKTLIGPISINTKGIGFFALPSVALLARHSKSEGGVKEEHSNKNSDLEIQPENLMRAFQGDIVEVVRTGKKIPKPNQGFGRANSRKGESFSQDREQGKVVKIISRAKNQFVGTIQKNGNVSFLVPDDKKMYVDIFIQDEKEKVPFSNSEPRRAPSLDNKKVLVEIMSWDEKEKNPKGKIVKIIGNVGENNTEMESIVLEKGFRVEFPTEVTAEAERIKSEYKKHFEVELKNRRDMRDTLTMTIDPADAKDFDDAISFKDLKDGTFEIGVHIADVSYFVTPNTVLDTEAQKRGLSVYLVDRTIPMLPEVLSNDLCSLNPNEDKYTFSAVFKIDKNAKILDKWFGRTIIYSDKRFTYEVANDVIVGKTKGPHQLELRKLNELAKIMEKQKFNNGAINFETDEVKFVLDEKGKPLSVYRKTRLDTHKLVEEYMLLANRAVAEHIFHSQSAVIKKGSQSVYRIHGNPDRERIQALAIFLKALGFDLRNKDGEVTSRDINKLLKEVEGTPNEELIKTATIRSMQKAVYSTKNIGHFGLAFRFYTHFTSPIRRYPDLLVHRFLEREIKGGKIEKNEFEKFERICLESSDLEKRASDAERASIKYKQVEYMSEHVGETFSGTITGVTEWGIYIEDKETKCEGMAKLRDLNDDFYILDEKNYTIKGQKTGKKYTLGDSVTFKVVGADMEKRVLDYAIV